MMFCACLFTTLVNARSVVPRMPSTVKGAGSGRKVDVEKRWRSMWDENYYYYCCVPNHLPTLFQCCGAAGTAAASAAAVRLLCLEQLLL